MNALAYIDNYSREREGKGAHILATLHPCGQFHQHVYAKFLHVQIPKAQKDSQVITVFLHFWDLRM